MLATEQIIQKDTNMWISEERIHVYRGRGQAHRCDRCGFFIREGETYRRRVWRAGKSPRRLDRLYVDVEHYNEEDCPWEDMEEHLHELSREARAETAIQMIVSSRLVVKQAINGETVVESEPFIEMKTTGESPGASEATEREPYVPSDDDDEIPF